MKTNKTKLTPKLLSEILNVEVQNIALIKDNKLFYNDQKFINLDTLTMKMMDHIKSRNLVFNLYPSSSIQGWVLVIDKEKYLGGTIFDVVLDATLYVYKIKGVEDENSQCFNNILI